MQGQVTGVPPVGLFVVAERYVRVEATADDPDVVAGDFAGLWVEVRSSLTWGERANLIERLRDLDRERDDIYAAAEQRIVEEERARAGAPESGRLAGIRAVNRVIAEMNEALETIPLRRLALIAPYVRAWNLPGPPPAQAGIEAFDVFPAAAIPWLERMVTTAYRLGKGVLSSLPRSNGLPGPTPVPSTTTPAGGSADSS